MDIFHDTQFRTENLMMCDLLQLLPSITWIVFLIIRYSKCQHPAANWETVSTFIICVADSCIQNAHICES